MYAKLQFSCCYLKLEIVEFVVLLVSSQTDTSTKVNPLLSLVHFTILKIKNK